jgi:hypothetical protein
MNQGKNKRPIIRSVVLLILLAFLILIGAMTYQKMPVLSLIGKLGAAIPETDFHAVSECFPPDSQERETIAAIGSAAALPFLDSLTQGLASIAGAFLDYQVDVTQISITLDGDTGIALVGLTGKEGGDVKAYASCALMKVENAWYLESLPTIVRIEDRTESPSFWYYMNVVSDKTALLFFGLTQ